MLEAAAQGLGIAVLLARHYHEGNDLRLAPIFDYNVASPYNYYFVCRPRAMQNRAVRIFHDWLIRSEV
jgi:LysR family glycine cleavage system transcriptional activator